MKYTIKIRKEALKELKSLPKETVVVITESINNLADNPRPPGCKKLKGTSEILWRVREGNYRIIYSIDDTIRIVGVRKIGHRKDIYDS